MQEAPPLAALPVIIGALFAVTLLGAFVWFWLREKDGVMGNPVFRQMLMLGIETGSAAAIAYALLSGLFLGVVLGLFNPNALDPTAPTGASGNVAWIVGMPIVMLFCGFPVIMPPSLIFGVIQSVTLILQFRRTGPGRTPLWGIGLGLLLPMLCGLVAHLLFWEPWSWPPAGAVLVAMVFVTGPTVAACLCGAVLGWRVWRLWRAQIGA